MPVRCLVALVAGLALSAAFPPYGLWWLVVPAVAVLFLVVDDLSPRQAWLPGLLFGVGFQYSLLWWMRAVGDAPYAALAGVEAAACAVVGALAPLVARRRGGPLWLAALWLSAEVVRSTSPFGGMPWGRLGFSTAGSPMAPALAYAGVNGVSLLLALAAALTARLVLAVRRRDGSLSAALRPALVVVLLLLPALVPYTVPVTGHREVAAVQGDVPGDGTDILLDYRQVTRNHVDATVELVDEVRAGTRPEPDFIVWPENSTAVDPFLDPQTHDDVETAVRAAGVPILVGAIVEGGPEHVLNQGIVWDPQTGAADRYTKRHPVPFGEFIPWRPLFADLFSSLNAVPRDMVRGTRTTPLSIGGTEIADAICFDVGYDDGLYAQVRHGGELLVVQTSNATFIKTAQIDQQLAISRARAVETGRWMVIASTDGRTAIIRPDGTIASSVPKLTQAVAQARVGLATAVTPGVLAGPWVGRGAELATLVVLALTWLRARYRRPDPEPESTGKPSHTVDRTPA